MGMVYEVFFQHALSPDSKLKPTSNVKHESTEDVISIVTTRAPWATMLT